MSKFYIWIYIFLFHFVANEVGYFKIANVKNKKWKYDLIKTTDSTIQQIKSSGLKKSFVRNENFVYEGDDLFTYDTGSYYNGVLGDIITNFGVYGILLGDYNGNGNKIGHVNIDDVEDFKSYFSGEMLTDVEFEAFKNETETPKKKKQKKVGVENSENAERNESTEKIQNNQKTEKNETTENTERTGNTESPESI